MENLALEIFDTESVTDFVENGEFVSGGVEDGWEIAEKFDGLINNGWHDNGKEGNNETNNEDI